VTLGWVRLPMPSGHLAANKAAFWSSLFRAPRLADAQRLFDIASKSSGQCWSMTSYCPVPGPVPSSPANRGYRAGFTAAMMLKDLRLAQDAARAAKAATPLGAAAAELYGSFAGHGHSAEDFSAIYRWIRSSFND